MIRYRVLQLLLLISSMMPQMIGMLPAEKVVSSIPFQVEGIAQKIEELPKELKYKILSSALELRENPKYELYRKFDVGSSVRGIALNADNTRALTGSDDGLARLWDVENGKLLKELKGHTAYITSVALSADGTLALTGSLDGKVQLWNIITGELLKTLQESSTVYSVALSANGALALTSSFDNIVRLYNTSTGELLKELKGHTDTIISLALSVDSTLALTGSYDGTARLWDITTGELLKTLEAVLLADPFVDSETLANSCVESAALSADGTIALTAVGKSGATKCKVLVWDAKSGALLNTLLVDGYVYAVALSKDGKRALTGTDDGNIQVWNVQPLPGKKETSTPLTVLKGHPASITTLAFGDADFIASSSFENTALIWKPFALEPRGRPLEHEEVLRQAYKETFSRPIPLPTNRK